jgi:hypothetical protein
MKTKHLAFRCHTVRSDLDVYELPDNDAIFEEKAVDLKLELFMWFLARFRI